MWTYFTFTFAFCTNNDSSEADRVRVLQNTGSCLFSSNNFSPYICVCAWPTQAIDYRERSCSHRTRRLPDKRGDEAKGVQFLKLSGARNNRKIGFEDIMPFVFLGLLLSIFSVRIFVRNLSTIFTDTLVQTFLKNSSEHLVLQIDTQDNGLHHF